MSSAALGIEETWSHATADIPARGLEGRRQAAAAERAALARSLEILAIDRLEASYRIKPVGDGRYRLSGTLSADVSQACVVSLEPVASTVEDHMDVEFRATGASDNAAGEEEQSALEAAEIEPIEQGRIAVGRIVVETLAAALPAYPRAPGAELESHEAGPTEPGASPFAALAGWKPKRD